MQIKDKIIKKMFPTKADFSNNKKLKILEEQELKKMETNEKDNTYKIEKDREKYRITEDDVKFFLLFYFVVFLSGGLGILFATDFVLRWNIIFFALLILPFFALDLRSRYITRKRKSRYVDTLIKESSSKRFQGVFVFYPEDDSNLVVNNFELGEQVVLDTRFALKKLHEVKRFALKKNYDAIINLRFNPDGTASFILARKKSNKQ